MVENDKILKKCLCLLTSAKIFKIFNFFIGRLKANTIKILCTKCQVDWVIYHRSVANFHRIIT